MRTFLLLFLSLIFLNGCSRSTAFEQTGTIVRAFETEAILSTIYLNRVYPEKYKDGEYFFAALYTRENVRLYFKAGLNNKKYKFTCNGYEPVEGQELKPDDELRLLMPINNEWNRYFLIKFPTQYTDKLDLILENDQAGSVHLEYHKEDE